MSTSTGKTRGRRGFRVLGLLIVLVLLGGWLYLVYGSPVLATDDVVVSGDRRLTKAQVETAAAVPMGMPLARVDLDAVESRVLRLPQVKSVLVERQWPGTVRIEVRERVPVATVSRNGSWWLVDDEAVVVATPVKRPRLPALDVANPSPADAATRSALAVVEALPKGLTRKVRTVTADTPDSVKLRMRGSVVAVWGNAGQTPKKARVFAALRTAEPEGTVYDVSTPDTATVVR